jgi:hypothetical protein
MRYGTRRLQALEQPVAMIASPSVVVATSFLSEMKMFKDWSTVFNRQDFFCVDDFH